MNMNMNMNFRKLTFAVVAVLALTAMVFSYGRNAGCCQKGIQVNDPAMIEGKIVKVQECDKCKAKGLHLFVQANKTETEIRLGPSTWLNEQGLSLNAGDAVKIKAYKGTMNNTAVLFAAEITDAKAKTVTLRDKDGNPSWQHRCAPDMSRKECCKKMEKGCCKNMGKGKCCHQGKGKHQGKRHNCTQK